MSSRGPIHRPPGPGQRTYSHLSSQRRMPSEYELVTTALLYYPKSAEAPFELDVPVRSFYERFQRGSAFAKVEWERFRDPRETTYTRYTALQKNKEIFVDGLLESMAAPAYHEALPEAWRTNQQRLVSAGRYLGHGLQMLAAYVGQMAPGGRVVMAGLFQAADEMRRVHRFAYRLRQLSGPAAPPDGRALWQSEPRWQPCREVIERLLVTYDLGEALIALNVVLKPMLDEVLGVEWGRLAAGQGDPLFRELLLSLFEDARWHREWSAALVRLALSGSPSLQETIDGWIALWLPRAERAVSGLVDLMTEGLATADSERARCIAAAHAAVAAQRAACGLAPIRNA